MDKELEEAVAIIKKLREALSQADTDSTDLNRQLIQTATDFVEKHAPISENWA
jgi:hypothetical protein